MNAFDARVRNVQNRQNDKLDALAQEIADVRRQVLEQSTPDGVYADIGNPEALRDLLEHIRYWYDDTYTDSQINRCPRELILLDFFERLDYRPKQ